MCRQEDCAVHFEQQLMKGRHLLSCAKHTEFVVNISMSLRVISRPGLDDVDGDVR